jgi:hypothetical protein
MTFNADGTVTCNFDNTDTSNGDGGSTTAINPPVPVSQVSSLSFSYQIGAMNYRMSYSAPGAIATGSGSPSAGSGSEGSSSGSGSGTGTGTGG